MKHLRVDVCVLGTNPAGLALAGLLARSGIDTLAVSRRTGLADAPRRQRLDAQCLAVLRDQGLQHRLDRVARASAATGGNSDISPLLLSVLQLDEAQRLGAEVRFGTEVLDVRQDTKAVYAQLRNLGDDECYEVIADYLVGADDTWQKMGRHQGRLLCTEAGVADAYKLAWRLALVVKGQANSRLLDAYDAEAGAAVVAERVPVVPLQVGHDEISSVDLVGKGCFTVLTGPGGKRWRLAARRQTEALGIPIKVIGIGPAQEAEDPYGAWAQQSRIEPDGCLLVRPDGAIALRAVHDSEDAETLLAASLCRHLGREH